MGEALKDGVNNMGSAILDFTHLLKIEVET